MNYSLDVVVPVKFPSIHLDEMRVILENVPSKIRVNYVLDCHGEIKVDSSQLKVKSHERIFTGAFGSPGFARNAALDNSDAEFVIFWDVDDKPDLRQTESFLRYLENRNGEVGIANWSFIDSPGNLQGISPFSVGWSPGIWRFMFRRETIEGTRFSNLHWGEDQLFILEVLSKGPRIITYEGDIYGYRKDVSGSLTKKRENVTDLFKANEMGSKHVISMEGGAIVCAEVMLFRQLLTLIKYGKVVVVLRLLRNRLTKKRVRGIGFIGLLKQLRKARLW